MSIEKINANGIVYDLKDVEDVAAEAARAVAAEEELREDIAANEQKLADLIGEAPETLDSIHEIAEWINNDATGAAAMASQINENKNKIDMLQDTLQQVEGTFSEALEEETARATAAEATKKAKRNYVKVDGETATIISKYNKYWDIVVTFKKVLKNELYSIEKVFLAENHGNELSTEVSNRQRLLCAQDTSDMIGPVMVNRPTTGKSWVGGNHLYMNQQSGVKSAATIGFSIYADDKLIEEGAAYADVVTVKVENSIFDPDVAPASGAAVLSSPMITEHVSYRINGGEVCVGVEHRYLKDVSVVTYYGMQSMFLTLPESGSYAIMKYITAQGGVSDWRDFIFAQPAVYIKKADAPRFNRFSQKREADGHCQNTVLLPYGLGNHAYTEDNIFVYSGNKAYHVLIQDKAIAQGEVLSWMGVYNWNRPIADDEFNYVYDYNDINRRCLSVTAKKAYGGVSVPAPAYAVNSLFKVTEVDDAISVGDVVVGGFSLSATAQGSIKGVFIEDKHEKDSATREELEAEVSARLEAEEELREDIAANGQKIVDLIGEAPETLDSIHEIAEWINNDATGAAAMASQINENKNKIDSLQDTLQQVEGTFSDALEEEIQSVESDLAAEVSRAKDAEEKIRLNVEVAIDIPLSVTGYYINEDSGKLQTVVGKGYCGLIPVRPGDKYLYSGQATAYVVGVAGYDSKGNFVNRIIVDRDDAIIKAGVCEDVLFIIPENIAYIGCSTSNQSEYPLKLKKIYSAIEYEQRPFYSEVAYNKMRGFNIATTSGNVLDDKNSEATDFIPVKAGDIIKYCGLASGARGIACFDSEKTYLSPLLDFSNRDGVHFIAKNAIDAIAVVPAGCSYIRASSNDFINNPLSIKIKNGSLQYGKKYVWFGDSLSALGSLPHQVGAKMGVDVIDVSFAGAPLTYSSTAYQGTGFMELVNCIVENDYTIVENALSEQATNGLDITDKYINLNNLKTINWLSVTNVVIMAGANDMSVAETTLEKIRSGFSSALQKLITKYPHLSIYFVSSTWRSNSSNAVNGLDMISIIDTIKDVCEDFSIPFLYFYKSCGINQYNKNYFLNSDGLHPSLFGESLISTKIANWLQSV